mmetsp:Transcript_11847/g.11496  ORF Transcript_11847/g.11496 Transcript_11847/m.11496 type:complete len:172 (+) Transcript_11847:138-653(+)
MFLLPLDFSTAFICLGISFLFEFIRIFIAFFLSKPSDELRQLKIQKGETALEVVSIKSVNLEFVRHSLLTRKVIKIEKRIETIEMDHAPKVLAIKKNFRIFRVIFYIACGLYLYQRSVVMINPQVAWPLSWFTKSDLVSVSPLSIIFMSGLAIRYILRTTLPIVFRGTVFP